MMWRNLFSGLEFRVSHPSASTKADAGLDGVFNENFYHSAALSALIIVYFLETDLPSLAPPLVYKGNGIMTAV